MQSRAKCSQFAELVSSHNSSKCSLRCTRTIKSVNLIGVIISVSSKAKEYFQHSRAKCSQLVESPPSQYPSKTLYKLMLTIRKAFFPCIQRARHTDCIGFSPAGFLLQPGLLGPVEPETSALRRKGHLTTGEFWRGV